MVASHQSSLVANALVDALPRRASNLDAVKEDGLYSNHSSIDRSDEFHGMSSHQIDQKMNNGKENIDVKGSLMDKDSSSRIDNDSLSKNMLSSEGEIKFDSTSRLNMMKEDQSEAADLHQMRPQNSEFSEKASAVPSSQILRAAGFARLGVGLAFGTVVEGASRLFNNSSQSNYPAVASDANADRLAATLCRMRGAALKIGQMLSIQDETTVLPPPIARAMQSVRAGANPMPMNQLMSQLNEQLGESWRDLFIHFNEHPIAAASIGQVHQGVLKDGTKVAIKVQYPGVANSIESDLSNLEMLMRLSGLAPPGLFLEEIIRVGRKELMVECDYIRERENHLRFRELLKTDRELSQEKFLVPRVIDNLSTSQILTTEYAPGGTIEKVSGLSQEERNRIGRNILKLTIRELFVWRFMQTDPNWGNFLYDVGSKKTSLIDFGAAREFDKSFVDSYLKIVWANANKDRVTLLEESHRLGFLTGKENDLMINAHIQSGFVVGEPFAVDEPYDFRASKISARMSEHGSVFMKHRLT